MAVKVEVVSRDPAVKAERQEAAKRVLKKFEGKLPDLRLLAFFDDQDWNGVRRVPGAIERGSYFPIKEGGGIPAPARMANLIFVGVLSRQPGRAYDHGIYLHGSTCADETALIMTFAHELQHFVQYGFKRKLWAESKLIRELPNGVQEKEQLNWPDIPHEREARIVAKRVVVRLCGEDAVNRYFDRMIDEAQKGCIDQTIGEGATKMEMMEIEDLRFSRKLDSEIPYDLASGIEQIYRRLRPYKRDFESALEKMRRDLVHKNDYEDVDLSAYFDG